MTTMGGVHMSSCDLYLIPDIVLILSFHSDSDINELPNNWRLKRTDPSKAGHAMHDDRSRRAIFTVELNCMAGNCIFIMPPLHGATNPLGPPRVSIKLGPVRRA